MEGQAEATEEPGHTGGEGSSGPADAGDEAWSVFEDHDSLPEEVALGGARAVGSLAELEACRGECINLGFGGFVVRRGSAYLRPHCRRAVLDSKGKGFWARGAALHVAPAPGPPPAPTIGISHGEVKMLANRDELAALSGYFASLFRHGWRDHGEGSHHFSEFPGGEPAFTVTATWLAAGQKRALAEPWPIREAGDIGHAAEAAAYLDAPGLLHAAVRSWQLASPRSKEDLVAVVRILAQVLKHFDEVGNEVLVADICSVLTTLPRHQMPLLEDFLEVPLAGLAALDAKQSAGETLVGHIRNVFGVKDRGEEPGGPLASLAPHEFAVRVFQRHRCWFQQQPTALRRLLCHVDPAIPIEAPLCFQVAAAAASVATEEEEEVFAGNRMAVDIFVTGLAAAPDPAQAASADACVRGLFGDGRMARSISGDAGPSFGGSDGIGASAGGGSSSSGAGGYPGTGSHPSAGRGEKPILELDVLIRPGVPPSGAAIILSKVLSRWGAGGADAADAVLEGVATDRQKLRTLLSALVPHMAALAEDSVDRGHEWGSVNDLVVPELSAAFGRGANRAMRTGQPPDETLRLLFRVVFEPSGGLPGIKFPAELLQELRPLGASSATMAARHIAQELREAARVRPQTAGGHAEALWEAVDWNTVHPSALEVVVEAVRQWLIALKKSGVPSDERAAAKMQSLRLLRQLPLEKLDDPTATLGPPLPAHVLASLAGEAVRRSAVRLAAVEQENQRLMMEVARLRSEVSR